MVSSKDLIELIRQLSPLERLRLVEEILRGIWEEAKKELPPSATEEELPTGLMRFAGIFDDKEARVWKQAVEEFRQIVENEGRGNTHFTPSQRVY